MTHSIRKQRFLAVLAAVFAFFSLLFLLPTAGAADDETELSGANIQYSRQGICLSRLLQFYLPYHLCMNVLNIANDLSFQRIFILIIK